MASGSTVQPWIAKDRLGIPRGPFGALFRVSLDDKRQVMKALSALMISTGYKRERVSNAQWKKFQGSVEEPSPILDGAWIPKESRITTGSNPVYTSPLDISWSPTRRVPYWDEKKKRFATVPEHRLDIWFWPNFNNDAIHRMATVCGIPIWGKGSIGMSLSSIPYAVSDSLIRAAIKLPAGPTSFGKVSFIQEPGNKLRAVANPNRVVQLLLEPLRKELSRILMDIPTDYTFDQDSGVEVVRSWLDKGETVFTVDLSDATNNFPLSRQLITARRYVQAGLMPDLDYFATASRGPWHVDDPTSGRQRVISWKKGQPLGLGPSFAIFALTHNELLKDLQLEHGGNFVVLGDDVAVIGRQLHEAYREQLRLLGCPVSELKCLESNLVSEFAGRFITKEYTLPQLKWSDVSDRSFMDIARNLGPRSLGLLKPRQRRIVKLICEVPEWEGGLGWNPEGKTIKERMADSRPVMDRLEPEENVADLSTIESARSRMGNAVLIGLTVSVPSSSPLSGDGTKHGVSPGDRPDLPVVALGLNNVKKDDATLRSSGDPRGISTLEILERKLKGLDVVDHGYEEEDQLTTGVPSPRKRRSRTR
jgi:hypothetical protein